MSNLTNRGLIGDFGFLGDDLMSQKIEKELKEGAKKKKLTGDRAGAYVYGTMQKKTDWKPGKKSKKGQ